MIISHLILQIIPLSQSAAMASTEEWLQSLKNLHGKKKDLIRFVVLTGSTSDSPWRRPTDKHCVLMKNRPATSKQGCLCVVTVPVSVLAFTDGPRVRCCCCPVMLIFPGTYMYTSLISNCIFPELENKFP